MSQSDDLILRWRERLVADETMSDREAAELEDHLRETAGALQRNGLSDEEATHVAMMRIGKPNDIHAEYIEADPGVAWRRRAMWILGSFAGFLLWSWLIEASLMMIVGRWFGHLGITGWRLVALGSLIYTVFLLMGWKLLQATMRASAGSNLSRPMSPTGFVARIALLGALVAYVAKNMSTALRFYASHEWLGQATWNMWGIQLAFGMLHYAAPALLLAGICALIRKRGERLVRV